MTRDQSFESFEVIWVTGQHCLDEETYDVNNDIFSDSSSDNESVKRQKWHILRKILIQYFIGIGGSPIQKYGEHCEVDFESDIYKENYTYITFLTAQDSQCKFKQNDTNCSGRKKNLTKYRWIIGCTNYSDLGITHEKVDIPKQNKPRLNEILLDENFKKLDEPIDDGRDGDYDANVCNGFFSRNYAALAKVTKFYAKILFLMVMKRLDDTSNMIIVWKKLGVVSVHHMHLLLLMKLSTNVQTLIVQIVCLFLFKEGQLSLISLNTDLDHPHLRLFTLELKDNSYHSLIKSYPALGQILEAVEANRLKD
ncbi:hypothetical protein GLOIN_2v1780459 [Rhizophagus irregularis DAOM 181602=DAOM 197198]|uniref:Uncharacterized protein n=1 Tax=Rhizophagus irregularis (strain DAOM 181602 / DAOM 197198 / MUCL 43194) TaxID=747089 RepID=A0A2P4PMC3_RHIID|nr:hypothetical protein GLOIN_2v1780459 [Rhizophagus irregularis DAOM 181602=DAOM 197198]POG66525.1 hypothetical protein GLOIN_2v1780459 [Rhizophagus irregularis DAOM 181602=DAOM 197198]|eukprot:XP_025173391.1 hypothetical protein GLOIN_2v1780459 [Rhizophagus irregularis DAOM 181602=DAOM 197198]